VGRGKAAVTGDNKGRVKMNRNEHVEIKSRNIRD
jgi:hypothetical protein